MKKFIFLMEWCDHQFFKCVKGESIEDETLLKEVYDWVRWEADGGIYDSIVNDGLGADIEIQYAELSFDPIKTVKMKRDIFKKVIQEDEEHERKAKANKELQEKEMLKRLQEKYGEKSK